MKNKILGLMILSFISLINDGGSVQGQSKKRKAAKPGAEYPVSFCDTIVRQFYRFPEIYTVISNIDPEIQVTPVTLGDLYCYQIEFAEIRFFRNYEIWLNDIKFTFSLDSNNPNCSKAGDKIICLVDQIQLGNECLSRGMAETENKFDCIYENRWAIKLRGVICGNVFGPFSPEITNVSLQCGK